MQQRVPDTEIVVLRDHVKAGRLCNADEVFRVVHATRAVRKAREIE